MRFSYFYSCRKSALNTLSPILLILFVLSLLSSCSFKEPVLPNWQIKLNVPLQDELFKIGEEIANDSTITVQGADSLLHIHIEGEMDSEEVSASDFETDAIDTLHSFELGTIELDSLGILSTGDISLGTIFPDLANYIIPGQTIPMTLPDTTLIPPLKTIETTDFKGLKIIGGNIVIHFSNNLPFPLGPNSSHPNGIEVILFDSTMQQIQALHFTDIIYPGSSLSETMSLNVGNNWIYAPIYVQYIVPIAQSTNFDLNQTVLDTAGVEIDVELRNLEVEAAYAEIEKQTLEETQGFQWEDENRIREAIIQAGTLNLNFTNETPLTSNVEFTLPNFLTPANLPYKGTIQIPAQNQGSIQISIDGYKIINHINQGSFIDSLELAYSVETLSSQGLVQLNSSDKVSVGVSLESIVFSSLSGYLAPDTFEIDPFEDDDVMDYEDITPNFNLQDVEMNLTLSNEVSIENLSVDFEITGYHKNAAGQYTDSAKIEIHDYPINSGAPGSPVLSYISLSGSEVSDFLNILPTKIRSVGKVRVFGDVNISETAKIKGDYSFNVPLRLSIDGDAFFEGDIDTLLDADIDQDIQDAADEELQSAEVSLKVLNATPVGGSIILYVAKDSSIENIYNIDESVEGSYFKKEIHFQAGSTNSVSGYVTVPAENELTLSLSQPEIRLFQSPPLQVGYKVKLSDSGGIIALRGSDFIKISGIASFEINIEE